MPDSACPRWDYDFWTLSHLEHEEEVGTAALGRAWARRGWTETNQLTIALSSQVVDEEASRRLGISEAKVRGGRGRIQTRTVGRGHCHATSDA